MNVDSVTSGVMAERKKNRTHKARRTATACLWKTSTTSTTHVQGTVNSHRKLSPMVLEHVN